MKQVLILNFCVTNEPIEKLKYLDTLNYSTESFISLLTVH